MAARAPQQSHLSAPMHSLWEGGRFSGLRSLWEPKWTFAFRSYRQFALERTSTALKANVNLNSSISPCDSISSGVIAAKIGAAVFRLGLTRILAVLTEKLRWPLLRRMIHIVYRARITVIYRMVAVLKCSVIIPCLITDHSRALLS